MKSGIPSDHGNPGTVNGRGCRTVAIPDDGDVVQDDKRRGKNSWEGSELGKGMDREPPGSNGKARAATRLIRKRLVLHAHGLPRTSGESSEGRKGSHIWLGGSEHTDPEQAKNICGWYEGGLRGMRRGEELEEGGPTA